MRRIHSLLSYCAGPAGIGQTVQSAGNRLDDRGIVVQFLAEAKDFSLLQPVKPALGPTHSPTERISTALSERVKWLGRKADHPPPPSIKVKNVWSYISTLAIV